MPKRIERDRVRPVPGAFGLEKSKNSRECRNNPNLHYLTKTCCYSNHLYIYVEEEYGYASYLWVYPGTPEELVEDWCNRRVPWNSPNWLGYRFRGEVDQVDFRTTWDFRGRPWPRDLELVLSGTDEVVEGFSHISHFDGNIHIHEEDDSYLKVGYYEVRGVREPVVTVHLLDALAAL
jgi:hypothetical protein